MRALARLCQMLAGHFSCAHLTICLDERAKIAVISLTALPKTRGKLENAPLRFPRCGCSIAQSRQLFEDKKQGVQPASACLLVSYRPLARGIS